MEGDQLLQVSISLTEFQFNGSNFKFLHVVENNLEVILFALIIISS